MPLRISRIVTVWVTAWVMSAVMASSAGARLADPTVSYIMHFFSDVDGVNVFSHHSSSGVNAWRNVSMNIDWTHDVVDIPAIDAPPGSQEAVDAITTASRPITGNVGFEDFVKVRDEVQSSVAYGAARASYYVSTESDYFAQMVSINYSREFFADNLNVSAGASYGWDDIKPLADDDTQGTPDERNTLHWNVVGTQVLTPTTVLRVGTEYNQVRGLQHDPYRNVYVGGGNVPELHPDDRNRWDVFMRVSQYITNRSSVMMDYRYYWDSWNVGSHTIGGKLNQYITDEFIFQYRYRYYLQDAAFFFSDNYTQPGGIDGYQTGDYRLGDYGSHLFGGEILWFPHRILGRVGFLKNGHLLFSYEHYFNSNNFSANIFETGLRVTF